jgi:tRNA A37 threonylcarbamoyladenosine dehydratase
LASTGLGERATMAWFTASRASSSSAFGIFRVVPEAFGFVAVAVVIGRVLSLGNGNTHGTPEGEG